MDSKRGQESTDGIFEVLDRRIMRYMRGSRWYYYRRALQRHKIKRQKCRRWPMTTFFITRKVCSWWLSIMGNSSFLIFKTRMCIWEPDLRLDAQSEVSASTPICRNQRWHEWELRQYCPQNIYSLNQRSSTEHSKGKSCTDHAMSTLLQTEPCEDVTKNRTGVQNILRLQNRDFPLAFAGLDITCTGGISNLLG